ncbi:putative cupin superfamily sugar epimerase [Ancylobacter sp. 3268]|uniref:cupin domain-containing protein n=1 Tax=Ancylobacter sp. 3268 TaxID=2817752 RepID=UPI00285ADB1C|nr:cupin domain-containing protein [Ancylobacter sp. 3268]MDR6954688.1 putative cupin superfamily sugar epimerase [Ancylobacter sp. 3268]
MTADDIIALLDLSPGATCGFVRLTYVAGERIAPGGLPAPFERGRPMGSALYFLVTPQTPVRLHRIRNDQLYHYYLGDPLDVLLLRADGGVERSVVGPDLAAGQRVQLHIPGGSFHMARLLAGGRWFLGASTEWPGVEPEDVELGDAEALASRFPAAAAEIRSLPVPLAPPAGPVVLPPTGAQST